jgi:hypothetical protein
LGEVMRRREFITLLGGAVAVLPLAARAQPGNLRMIVVLGDRASAWSSTERWNVVPRGTMDEVSSFGRLDLPFV